MTLVPDPPAAGTDLKVDFTTDPLLTEITGGYGLLSIKLHGIPIAKEKFDTCSELGLKCPIATGSSLHGTITYLLPPTKIPSYLDLDCFFQVVDENGKTLDCVYFLVNEADSKRRVKRSATNNSTTSESISDDLASYAYDRWKEMYPEIVIEEDETTKRLQTFKTNLRMVDAHNKRFAAGKETYSMSMNAFSHLTWMEFRSQYIGGYQTSTSASSNVSKNLHYFNESNSMVKTLPSSIDWESKGAVTAVKNQGQCGSCWYVICKTILFFLFFLFFLFPPRSPFHFLLLYFCLFSYFALPFSVFGILTTHLTHRAFSTTGSLEGAYFLQTGNLRSLSEQQLVDCDRKIDQGCNGGLMDNAFDYVAKNGGLCQESDYPYVGEGNGKEKCSASTCKSLSGTGVTKHTDVAKDEVSLMSALSQQPVSVAIEADQGGFQFYSSGVFSGSCGTKLDHGVLAVGYGTTTTTTTTSNDGKKYWKVKNSWGATWGMKGFILLERGKKEVGGQCGILNSASYPTL